MLQLTLMLLSLLSLLILIPAAAEVLSRDSFLVQGLEEIEPAFRSFDGQMYAGLLPTTRLPADESSRGKLMFWLYEPRAPTVPDSLVIWLNGGPGCSSMVGSLFEHGPVTVPLFAAGTCCSTANPILQPNNYTWTKATTMLYVEQPVGTGFSFGPQPQNENDVASDFYNFLQNLLDVLEQRHKRLFVFGESYAGMYVPSIARKIYLENKKKNTDSHVNLQGIGLGNGWINAEVQGPIMIDYAWFHGMIDGSTRDFFKQEWQSCITQTRQSPPFHAFTTPDECGIMGAILKASGAGVLEDRSPNTYDVTTWDTYAALFATNGTFARFFNDPLVKKAMHAPNKDWSVCIPGEGRRRLKERTMLMLDDDRPLSVVPYIAELLDEAKIRVLVYNGDRDMSCCAQGSEICLDGMEWSGNNKWQSSGRGLWMVDGQVAGYAKAVKGLEFVVVYNSGHLVPLNQPSHALDLITRFLSEQHFSDMDLPEIIPAGGQIKKSRPKKKTKHRHAGLLAFFAVVVSFFGGLACALSFTSYRQKRYQYEML